MMTEPVAYVKIKDGKVYSMLRTATPNDEYTPVYTAEQLHSRVKMTQAEFDEFNSISEFASVYGTLITVFNNQKKYPLLYKRFNGSNGQAELANLWFEYRSNNRTQQETIDIVPDMKWFVRSKNRYDEGDYAFLSGIETPDDWGYSKNHDGVNEPSARAYAFDTKEEAEKWTNPLTEAVQLPVKGE